MTVTETWRNQDGKKGVTRMKADVYDRLADHYRGLGQPPQQERLEDLLEEIFTPLEAEVLLALHFNIIKYKRVVDLINDTSLKSD